MDFDASDSLPRFRRHSAMRATRRSERHGRGVRGPLLPTELPRFKTRVARFDDIVLDAYAPIEQRFRERLTHVDVAVDIVPRMRTQGVTTWPDEVVADGPVPLGRLVPAGVDRQGRPTRPRIVLFRRPLELRGVEPDLLRVVVSDTLVQLVATYLNVEPEFIDPSVTRD